MHKPRFLAGVFLALGVVTAAEVLAEFGSVQFSADMRQSGPQGDSHSKMYVGKDRMRMEMEQGGQRIVRIVDNSNNVEWILYPDQQSYVEHRLPQTATAGAGQADDANPCAAMPDANCENLGTETVSGRQAVKWKMTFSHQGKVYASTEWIDKERHMPLRSERADGSRSEMVFLGQDQLGGRPAEKWEMKSSQSGKAPESSYQWYDPQLDLAIREEFPGGFVRELVNIREGQQPESLFSVPAGFKQISIPGKGK